MNRSMFLDITSGVAIGVAFGIVIFAIGQGSYWVAGFFGLGGAALTALVALAV